MENSVENIDWIFNGTHLPDTQVNYTCNSNFVLYPAQYRVVCGSDGIYAAADSNNPNGTCVRGYYLACFCGS